MRLSLFRKLETDGAALMSYGRQFHIGGAAQRKARESKETVPLADDEFRRLAHGLSDFFHIKGVKNHNHNL